MQVAGAEGSEIKDLACSHVLGVRNCASGVRGPGPRTIKGSGQRTTKKSFLGARTQGQETVSDGGPLVQVAGVVRDGVFAEEHRKALDTDAVEAHERL